MPHIDIKPIMDAATSLKKTLVQIRRKHPDLTKIAVHITETEEAKYKEPTGTSARMVVVITAATSQRAFDLSQPFANQGCTCTSTGEEEVTCDCPWVE